MSDIVIRAIVTEKMRDDFKRICKNNNVKMSDLIRGWIADYIEDNQSEYDVYIKPFIDECEQILNHKIDKALEKDKLVLELTRGADINDVEIINQMLDYLNDFNISYDGYEGTYSLNWMDASGNPECEGIFNDAEHFVEWYIEEYI